MIDQLGRTIKLENKPRRIISLVPSQTELLFDLGLNEEVIGITKFCIHPPIWHSSKEKIGGTKNLNIDKIIQLKPDLIIANKEENDQDQIKSLIEQFPVWISDIKNLDDACLMIKDISELVDKSDNGKEIIKKIKKEFTKLDENLPKISCSYLIWDNPIMTVGGDTFISDMLARAGFNNVFQHKQRYPETTIEELKEKNPKYLLLSSEPYPYFEKLIPDYERNFPKMKIRLVDGELFSWYGSRLLNSPDYFLELRYAL